MTIKATIIIQDSRGRGGEDVIAAVIITAIVVVIPTVRWTPY